MPTQNILASRCRVLHSSENINIYLWLKTNCATPRNQNNEELWLSFMKSNTSTASCFDTEPGIVIFIELKSTQSSQQDLSGWEQSRLTDLQRHTMTRLFPFGHTSLSLSCFALIISPLTWLTLNEGLRRHWRWARHWGPFWWSFVNRETTIKT